MDNENCVHTIPELWIEIERYIQTFDMQTSYELIKYFLYEKICWFCITKAANESDETYNQWKTELKIFKNKHLFLKNVLKPLKII
jgi:hypothetical protein